MKILVAFLIALNAGIFTTASLAGEMVVKTGVPMSNIDKLTIFIAVAGVFYFLPAIVAGARGHNNRVAIFCVNLAFGWTLIGWAIAFVWAVANAPVPFHERIK